MPDENRFTGVSRNLSMPEKSTISSKRRRISLARMPKQRAVEEDVLPASELGVEARADLEQAAHPAAQLDQAGRGRGDPGQQLEQRRLARSVATDDADGLADRDLERHVVQRVEALDRVAAQRVAQPLHHRLGRPGGAVGTAVADPVHLRQAGGRERQVVLHRRCSPDVRMLDGLRLVD